MPEEKPISITKPNRQSLHIHFTWIILIGACLVLLGVYLWRFTDVTFFLNNPSANAQANTPSTTASDSSNTTTPTPTNTPLQGGASITNTPNPPTPTFMPPSGNNPLGNAYLILSLLDNGHYHLFVFDPR
ncbi:MAG: hypothetical protein ACPL3P_09920, partial [Anaerolineales bacterium]